MAGSSVHQRSIRLLRLMVDVKMNPRQTVEALLKRYRISKTQFYEDRQAIQKGFGFEFRYDRQKGEFEILEDPLIPVYRLTLTELLAIVMAVRQLSAASDYILTYEALQAVLKLIQEIPLETRRVLQASLDDIVLREGFGCQRGILDDLQRAVLEHRRCRVTYASPEEGTHEWIIDPYQIFFRERALYVDANCVRMDGKGMNEVRMFRVNRIKSITLTGVEMPGRSDYVFNERHRYSFGVFTGGSVYHVKIRFAKRLALYIKETCWHFTQQTTDLDDGGVLFEVEVCQPREVVWWVMQYGAEAEVLEPPEVRMLAAQMAREMVKLYGKS